MLLTDAMYWNRYLIIEGRKKVTSNNGIIPLTRCPGKDLSEQIEKGKAEAFSNKKLFHLYSRLKFFPNVITLSILITFPYRVA